MIFDSSIRRELASSFSASLFVLVIILLTMMLVRTLNYANKGIVGPSEVSLVLGFTALAYLAPLLILSLFISIVYCFSRMYRDSEMAVWFASGKGLFDFLQPVARFSLPILGLTAIMSMMVWPWANTQVAQLQHRFQTRGNIDRIAPGQFQESADGNAVFYVSSSDAQTQADKLFVYLRRPKSETIVTAQGAHLDNQDKGRFVVINQGRSTEITQDKTINIGRFRELAVRMGDTINAPDAQGDSHGTLNRPRTVPTLKLIQQKTPAAKGELGWRLGMIFTGINFVLIALALVYASPRSSKGASLGFALLCFASYYNLLNASKKWVRNGDIDLFSMLLFLHGGVFIISLLWLAKRHYQWSFRNMLVTRK